MSRLISGWTTLWLARPPRELPCDRNTGSRCALRVVRPVRQRHGRYRGASWRPVTSNSAHRPSLSSLPESSIPALSTRSGLSFSAAFSSVRSIRFSWAWLGVRGFGPLRGFERGSHRCFGPGFMFAIVSCKRGQRRGNGYQYPSVPYCSTLQRSPTGMVAPGV